MEPQWMILLLVAVAQIHLALMFVPSYWTPLLEPGKRWLSWILPVGIPLWMAGMLLLLLANHRSELSEVMPYVVGAGIGACTATMILGYVRLRGERSESV